MVMQMIQAAIKKNYIDFMTRSNLVPPFFCQLIPDCKEDYVKVYAGSSGITKYNKA